MSSEKYFEYENCNYFSTEKRSSVSTKGQLAEKCLSALLFTVKRYVASMKFSIFQENYVEIYQSHPDNLKEIHNQLQVQLGDRLKEIVLKLFIKHISSRSSSLDNPIVDKKNEWNKCNKSLCFPHSNSINCSSYPKNKFKLKNQRRSRNEIMGAKQAIKRLNPSTAVEKSKLNRTSTTEQANLKRSTNVIMNKYRKIYWRSSPRAKFHCEKQRLISVLSKLHSCNEDTENMMFRIHEEVVIWGNRIQDLNKKVMVELDKLYERYIFKQNNRSLAIG